MPNMNIVHIAGHLGRDPEMRFIANGAAVCSFTVALSEKTANGEDKPPSWVDCEAWGTAAEAIASTCSKGDGIYITGRLKMDSWNSEDGQRRTKLKVVVDLFAKHKKREAASTGGKHENRETQTTLPPKQPGVEYYPEPDVSDIPFVWALLFIVPALWSAINGTGVV